MVSHDKIKAAARRRMARTGESYVTARREVIKAHKATRRRTLMSEVVDFQGLHQIIDMRPIAESLRYMADAQAAAVAVVNMRPIAESLRQAALQAQDVRAITKSLHPPVMPKWPID